MSRRIYILIFLDIVFILLGFGISVLLKGASIPGYFLNYFNALCIFCGIWVIASLVYGKYVFEKHDITLVTSLIIKSNLIIVAITTFLIFLLRYDQYSRFIVFGTIGFTTLVELFVYNLWVILKKTRVLPEDILTRAEKRLKRKPVVTEEQYRAIEPKRLFSIRKSILSELGHDAYCYIESKVNLNSEATLVFATTTLFNIENQPENFYNAIVNLKRVNDIRYVNKFFEAVNAKLPKTGTFICMAETKEQRKRRILRKYPPILNYIYYTFDYILKRVFPKFSLTKNVYFLLTRGENRVLSRAEILGRLYSCGFEVVAEQELGSHFFVVAKKIKNPAFDLEPTYGPIIKLCRVGKHGKIIKVYKMRTMHPYSEYLQDYVFRKHSLQEGGKFKDDFRISTIGRIMRKLWIDELPMLINLLRGDVKIVGVRPLSPHYFSLYTKELQEKRIKFKPGLIPPFYVDNPKTLEEIMASEIKYLNAYEKHPLLTDMKYFFVAVYNIVFKRYRSN
jgi:lipopolysaccharide/colanic/teichoic acid biosynthesis glycosyltransferase